MCEPLPASPAAPALVPATRTEALDVMGTQLLIHLTGHQTAGQAFISTLTAGPGTGVPPHTHALEDEIFHVLEGEVEIIAGDTRTIAGPGDSAFLPRGLPHAWWVHGNQTARFVLTITPSGMEDMFRELSALPAGPPDLAAVGSICQRYGITFAGV